MTLYKYTIVVLAFFKSTIHHALLETYGYCSLLIVAFLRTTLVITFATFIIPEMLSLEQFSSVFRFSSGLVFEFMRFERSVISFYLKETFGLTDV